MSFALLSDEENLWLSVRPKACPGVDWLGRNSRMVRLCVLFVRKAGLVCVITTCLSFGCAASGTARTNSTAEKEKFFA